MSRQTPNATWNPIARAIWEHGTGKPDAEAVTDGHGHTVFRVRDKTFVYFGGPAHASISVKLSPGTRSQLRPDPARAGDRRAYLLDGHPVTSTHYIGQHGWVDVDVADRRDLAFALALIDESYEQVAPRSTGRAAGGRPAKKPAVKKPAAKKPAAKQAPAGKMRRSGRPPTA